MVLLVPLTGWLSDMTVPVAVCPTAASGDGVWAVAT